MKIKKPAKPKRLTKAAKILALKRSEAAKRHHHRRRARRLAHQHLAVFVILVAFTLVTSGVALALAGNLIPPPSPDVNYDAYFAAARAKEQAQNPSVKPPDQVGKASWYALGLRSPDALTCASRTFPRGTSLEVTDLRNGNKVICLVNDYGPAAFTGRVIDLSRGSYRSLEGLGSGTMPVEIRVVH
jgi:rare lipoprotein A (peptidoglycan hydrolase)